MKRTLKKIPIINVMARYVYRKFNPIQSFENSEKYWIERYKAGDNSGDGSYNKLAVFKAELLNSFVQENGISTVIEYGSGDGNQLKLARYPNYKGFDVSSTAVKLCREIFKDDESKKFNLVSEYSGEEAQLTLSLDVIYHLIEDRIFNEYMNRLFSSSEKFVIIYASNTDENPEDQLAHVKHRKFTNWIESNKVNWTLRKYVPNKYPYDYDADTGSFADFYIFEKN